MSQTCHFRAPHICNHAVQVLLIKEVERGHTRPKSLGSTWIKQIHDYEQIYKQNIS